MGRDWTLNKFLLPLKIHNNRKPICRLHLNGGVKYISLFDSNKKEIKEKIESVDDIYKYEKELLQVVDFYENRGVGKMTG